MIYPIPVRRFKRSSSEIGVEYIDEYIGVAYVNTIYSVCVVIGETNQPQEIPADYLGIVRVLTEFVDHRLKPNEKIYLGNRVFRVRNYDIVNNSYCCFLDLPESQLKILSYQIERWLFYGFWDVMHKWGWIKEFNQIDMTIRPRGLGLKYLRPFGLWRTR